MIKELFFAQRKQSMWKKLSSELRWTEEMLTHYADKVDWQSISSNNKVVWTKSLIHKFTDKLNWEELSKNDAPTLVRPIELQASACRPSKTNSIRRDEKTGHINWTPMFVEEMKEYLDWEKLFKIASCEEQEYLLNKYFKYITRVKFSEFRWNRFPQFKKYVDEHWVERASEILGYAIRKN